MAPFSCRCGAVGVSCRFWLCLLLHFDHVLKQAFPFFSVLGLHYQYARTLIIHCLVMRHQACPSPLSQ